MSRRGWNAGASVGVLLCAALSLAPTVGDVGGCGTDPTLLEPEIYAYARKVRDCAKCQECGVGSMRCARACDEEAAPEFVLPPTCRPLLHDGEVCLRALDAASCETFARYVADEGATSPSECNFCVLPDEGGQLGAGQEVTP